MRKNRPDAKLAKRSSMTDCTKLNIRDGWYYAKIEPNKPVKIIAESAPIQELLKDEIKSGFLTKFGKQAIYSISQPANDNSPTVVYMGNNLYGIVYIVAMIDGKEELSFDFLPFNNLIAAIDLLWFPLTANLEVEICSLPLISKIV